MKATGIVRRIDDLGRVVIPKEIRRTMRIREGDPLEIFTDREGEIILKKYSPMGEMSSYAKDYADSLASTLGCTVCISDQDQIVAASGVGKKELQEKNVSRELETVMQERESVVAGFHDKNFIKLTKEGEEEFSNQVICPIISDSDVVGTVSILDRNEKKKFGEMEQKVALCAANFLGRQMEQ